MATVKDVARKAGVSPSTVSYVLSGSRPISPGTRSRVERAMIELNYRPNAAARALVSQRSRVIGVVARLSGDVAIASTTPFIDTITEQAHRRDYDVVLITRDDDIAGIQRIVGTALVDALVVMDIQRFDTRLPMLEQLRVPTVLIGLPEARTHLTCVEVDAGKAAELALAELGRSGCKQIVLIGEMPAERAPAFGYVPRFEAAARRYSKDHDLTVEVVWSDEDGWAGHGAVVAKIAELARSRGQRPLGVVARTPQAVDALFVLLAEYGLRPGRDLMVVGLCPDTYAANCRIPVTNVSLEAEQVSIRATDALFGLVKKEVRPAVVHYIPPRLTPRATTASPL